MPHERGASFESQLRFHRSALVQWYLCVVRRSTWTRVCVQPVGDPGVRVCVCARERASACVFGEPHLFVTDRPADATCV